MKRSTVGWIVAAFLALGVSGFAWVWFAGGSGEPSTELTTPEIAEGTTTTIVESGPSTTQEVDTPKTFVIDSSQSVASFEIDEELRGQPQHVIGETDQVAGQVRIDLSTPSATEFSQIIVNARTFQTGQERRDRAIRGPIILNSASDEHEFITLDVTGVDGLDAPIEVGDGWLFTVTGDLTIRGVTGEAVFEVNATLVDESTVEGTATAPVLRSDFGIGIPSVPGVANVTDEVILNLDFVATSS